MLKIAKLALCGALPLFVLSGSASADEARDKLHAMCVESGDTAEVCNCQVDALIANMDARAVAVLAASGDASKAATPEEGKKIMDAALAAAGITEAEFTTLMEEGGAKAEPAMKACKP